MANHEASEGLNSIDVSGLASGLYSVVLGAGSKVIRCQVVVFR